MRAKLTSIAQRNLLSGIGQNKKGTFVRGQAYKKQLRNSCWVGMLAAQVVARICTSRSRNDKQGRRFKTQAATYEGNGG